MGPYKRELFRALDNDLYFWYYLFMKKMKFEKVTNNNLELAIEVQRNIFPNEDGTINLKICADPSLVKKYYGKKENFRQIFVSWICKDDEYKPIGITGIYSYFEYPQDAWLSWFGVLPEHRELGYGERILKWTMNKSKKLGFNNLRLYTDLKDNFKAVELYKKIEMIKEPYTVEEIDGDIFIFSKSLISDKTEQFGNHILFLKEQEEIQKLSGDENNYRIRA